MSILIPTMKMPTGCAYCPINNDSVCQAMPELGYDDGNGSERRENCPLIELVQCKDCNNYITGFPCSDREDNEYFLCMKMGRFVQEHNFCSYGEREE